MQTDSLLQTTLRLAGYMAARGCVALRAGREPGVEYGDVVDDGLARAETVARGFAGGALRRGREMLRGKLLGVRSQVLVHAAEGDIEGSSCRHALLAEFDGASGRLAGLVVAMPCRPAAPGQAFAMHPAFVAQCPPALRPLADELLECFSLGLAASQEGFLAWMYAMAMEDDAASRPAAGERDDWALALTIRADDATPNSNARAAAHLDTFLAAGPFQDGLGFERALRPLAIDLSLDLSLASLGPLDALLDRLRVERRPDATAFLGVSAGLNFLRLLAVYLGETMALAAEAGVGWYTAGQLARRRGAGAGAPHAPHEPHELLAVFAGHAPDAGVVFRAQAVVMARLFAAQGAPTLAQAAAAALPAIRAARPASPDLGKTWRESRLANDFVIPRPDWASRDALGAWFDDLPALMRGGRVVLARLVQVNARLFQPGTADHPGEIVYDPRGVAQAADLDLVGRRLFALKGTRPRDARLRAIADCLTSGVQRMRGAAVPASLGARGLLVSTIVFHRRHLPGGRLASPLFPVLVVDALPGLAAVLPARFWRQDMPEGAAPATATA